jgi:hypothetical protein
MSKKKLHRYHREIYFPPWAEESLDTFVSKVMSRRTVVFSVHALEKSIMYSFEYGKWLFKFLMKALKKTSLELPNIFEFYAEGQEVSKACFRLSFEGFPVDLVLVVSEDGTVITLFTINKGDNHVTLNENLYEKGVK